MVRIKVDCYAGGRCDERPRRLLIDGRAHRVARLLDERLERAKGSMDEVRRYRLLTEEGLILKVVRDSQGRWYADE